ncbi:hypothetical protein DOM22_05390 [Bdellovibrio sp. ZAP7]|nr:hypothetical protein DOM22_05390 [Bdellovibrio sp. ZAP7]
MDALIILKEPLDKILSGKKTWEIRGKRCHKRGKIALIESKSGTIVGTAELVDCVGPLTVAEFNKNAKKAGASPLKSKSDFYYEATYAWVLKNAKRFKKPIKYKHKRGVVIWHPVDI